MVGQPIKKRALTKSIKSLYVHNICKDSEKELIVLKINKLLYAWGTFVTSSFPVFLFNLQYNFNLLLEGMNSIERIKHAWAKFTGLFSYRQKIGLIVIAGVLVGLGGLFSYLLRVHTYFIGDNPSACVNCHIMTPYYATWNHSSHNGRATCNDCHVPHQNLLFKYGFKAIDGLKHSAYFILNAEPQAIRAEKLTGEVVMDNCIRCHYQLNTEFVKTGRIGYMATLSGEGKACWDCHRQVPHGKMNSLSSTPWAETQVPIPDSPVPEWLQGMLRKK